MKYLDQVVKNSNDLCCCFSVKMIKKKSSMISTCRAEKNNMKSSSELNKIGKCSIVNARVGV